MRGDKDLARHRLQKIKGPLKIADRLRILATLRESESIGRSRRNAIGEDHVTAYAAFAGFPCPACAARSVAGSQMWGYSDHANSKRFSIAQFAHLLNRRDSGQHTKLRIAPSDTAVLQHTCTPV